MSVSRCVSYKVNMPYVPWDEGAEYVRALRDLTRSFYGCDVPEIYLSGVMLRSLFHLF